MENFAHTLLGLSLAKAGLERATPLATTALVVASNLPDVDVLMRVGGGTSSYLEYHRGFTHSFVGLALLALIITVVLTLIDRRFRLRRDHRRRPMRPLRLFWIAYLGGLGHTFMDFTNNYGVRPLLPFSRRWFYGDIVFVVDPWIWLILGSTVVWLTTTNSGRALFWLAVGVAAALMMATALQSPSNGLPPLPIMARVVWFVGLALILAGALLRWGQQGERLARYSLMALAIYYGGMWMAHQSALRHAANPPPAESVSQMAAWPTPANPVPWQAAAAGDDAVFARTVYLTTREGEWLKQPTLDAKFVDALRQSRDGRAFLDFARFYSANVDENGDGYVITLRDLRFDLRLRAELDHDLNVRSAETRWF
ncbi:MAG TPA: metal-dependent hydrolase [Blastocatellia bacterium]|nr:metal-dependent hydrolase [Blastocatellia bacterium]